MAPTTRERACHAYPHLGVVSVSDEVARLLSLSNVHSRKLVLALASSLCLSLLTVVNIERLAAGGWGQGSEAQRQVLEASLDLLVETSRFMNAHSGLEPAA